MSLASCHSKDFWGKGAALVFSHSFLLFWKMGGVLLQSIWFSAINGSKISSLSPLASKIAVNGYICEYPDDTWSEVLVSKNVLPSALGTAYKCLYPPPPAQGAKKASDTLQGPVICIILAVSSSPPLCLWQEFTACHVPLSCHVSLSPTLKLTLRP